MLHLRTFGGLTLETGHLPPSGAALHQSRLALLALLAASGRNGILRDRIYLLLWPESSIQRARGSLKQSLFALRRDLGTQALTLGRTNLRLNEAVIESDVEMFSAAIERGELELAVELYTGPFLEGVHIRESVEFDSWAEKERSRLAHANRSALERLALQAEERNDADSAVFWWRRLSEADRLSARIARSFMQALVARGDREAAIQHGIEFSRRLEQELDAVPDASVSDFVSELRRHPSTRSSLTAPLKAQVSRIDVTHGATHEGRREEIKLHRLLRYRVGIATAIGVSVVALASIATFGGNAAQRNSGIASGRFSPDNQILVGDFDASSGDSLSARALSETLRGALGASRAISIVSRAEIDRALRRMDQPISAQLDHSLAHELAVRNGYEAVLTGAITPLGEGYVLSARLTTESGKEILTLSESAASADALIPALGRLSNRFRLAIGESASAIDSVRPLEQVTTASLRALQLYTQAADETREARGNSDFTLGLLREAIAHDSAFAMAHRFLGIKLYVAGSTQGGLREIRLAERFSDRLTEIERLSALSTLHFAIRDYERSADEAAAVLRLDPRSLWAINQLGILDNLLGRYDHGRHIAIERSRVDSSGRSHLAELSLYAGRTSDALAVARRFFDRYKSSTGSPSSAEARRMMAWVHSATAGFDSTEFYSLPLGPSDAGSIEGLVSSRLARGQLQKAFATMGARASGNESPSSGFFAIAEANAALAEAITSADRLSSGWRLDAVLADREYHRGNPADRRLSPIFALALAGRGADARRELGAIEKSSDQDVLVARYPELSLARGAVALAEGKLDKSIDSFRSVTSSFSLGYDACRVCALPWLGRAYEAAGRNDSAVVAYERYLATGDPFRASTDGLWRAVVLRQLGNLYAQRGDTAKAIRRLEEFAALWSGADSALQPQVTDARKRIADLRPTRIGAKIAPAPPPR